MSTGNLISAGFQSANRLTAVVRQATDNMNRAEYIALVGSFFLVGLEAIIRILTLALRMYLAAPFLRASLTVCSIYDYHPLLSSLSTVVQSIYLTCGQEVRVEEKW